MVGGMDEQELQCEVAQIIGTGEEILAAAIFGLQDDYAKIFVAGVATGTAAAVAGLDEPFADDAAGKRIGLTGSTASFSPVAAGDKLVLQLLSASS
jgi:hypothetical protein